MLSPGDSTLRILLIEDNPADVYLICEALNEASIQFSIRHIADGEEAFRFVNDPEAMEREHPGLVLLDLNLPKIDGSEILESLRDAEHMKKIPIIVLTSSDSPQDKRHAAKFGARGYIRKPSTLEAFLQIGSQIKELSSGEQTSFATA